MLLQVRFETASVAVRDTLSQLDEVAAQADAADSQQHRQLQEAVQQPEAAATASAARRVACPRCHKELYCSEACQRSHAEAHGPFCATVAPEGLMLRAKMQAEALSIAQRESAEAAQCAEVLARCQTAAEQEEAEFEAAMAHAMCLGGGWSSSSHRR